jgi:ABC-2 type transport system ATP-binding protein
MAEHAITVEGMVKVFGTTRALDGGDRTVGRGEVDGGTATVFGMDPWRDAVALHRRLAYVPGDVALWPNLTGGETIDLLLRMRGADPVTPRRAELLERFQLDPTKRGRAYSKRNRQ